MRADTSVVGGGYPAFAIHPVIVTDPHYIIEYTEPLKGNENASDSIWRHCRRTAPHSNRGATAARSSPPNGSRWCRTPPAYPGFVARAPVYRQGMPLTSVEERRAALVGWVAIVFRVNNLMSEVIDPALLSQLTFRIHDAGDVAMPAPRPWPARPT
ncbi:CHASE domain-containing protein [Massilia sp. H-1]|nr:CHASE domain-containing protein [Massilia sp. H-1]